MRPEATDTRTLRTFLLFAAAMGIWAIPVWAQNPVSKSDPEFHPDWRRIGNLVLDAGLASPATGPIVGVRFTADGKGLLARLNSGEIFETKDFETWQRNAQPWPGAANSGDGLIHPPESGGQIRQAFSPSTRLFGFGRAAYRSDDSGQTWSNLTHFRGQSLIGEGITDLAISPLDADEIAVSNGYGVWHSLDGGLSWTGLNEGLPNLPVRKLLKLPVGVEGTRLLLSGLGAVEWSPGEKHGWRPVLDSELGAQAALRGAATRSLGVAVGEAIQIGEYIYAGGVDGFLWASADGARSWRSFQAPGGGVVTGLFADRAEPRIALAALASRDSSGGGPRLLRTMNGGIFWDDVTADLPPGSAHAVSADPASGAVYAATDGGVFLTFADLASAGPPTGWKRLSSALPASRVRDVRLDDAGNQLYVAVEGFGVFATTAPHRLRSPRLVNAADMSVRAAAPGGLLSVLGSKVRSVQAGPLNVPVLAATDAESQIQVPFEVAGQSLSLTMEATQEKLTLGLPLQAASPAIFVDRDGTPMLLDGDSGVLLDAMTPARSGTRIQILATGLGRVQPDWPTGLAAPLENPPRVVAPVEVFLDRARVDVTRATLAPGYVGFYLIEVQVPEIVNLGPAELYIQAGGQASNRVRVYLEP